MAVADLLATPRLGRSLDRLNTAGGGRRVAGVSLIADLADVEGVAQDALVVLTAGASADTSGYRFDVALRRAAQRDMGPIVARVLSEGLRASRHRQIEHFDDITSGRVTSVSTDAEGVARPFPIQVDGDYIGAHAELELGIDPGALTVVA